MGQTAKWSFWEIKYRERKRPLHIIHWAILVLFKGPSTWSQHGYRWYSSKPKSPLPHTHTVPQRQLMHKLCAIYPLVFFFQCKVLVLTCLPHQKAWDNPDRSPSPHRAPSAYPAAGWMCWRSEDERAFRTWWAGIFDRRCLTSFFFFFFLRWDCRKVKYWNIHVFIFRNIKSVYRKSENKKVRERPVCSYMYARCSVSRVADFSHNDVMTCQTRNDDFPIKYVEMMYVISRT